MIPQGVPTRPVVFLDIDGVLNSPTDYAVWSQKCREDRLEPGRVIAEVQSGNPGFDRHAIWLFGPPKVALLNEITEKAGADIVVSSSWRLFYGEQNMPELAKLMQQAGVAAPVLGCTPTRWHQRGEAILQWLHSERPGGSRLAILDDEPKGEFPKLGSWLLQTSSTAGLQSSDVARALRVLSAGPFYPKP